MPSVNQYLANIERGKDLDHSLSGYGNQMMNLSHRLSSLRFVMNYVTFYEALQERKSFAQAEQFSDGTSDWMPEKLQKAVDSLNEQVRVLLSEEQDGETLEQAVQAVDQLRKDTTDVMTSLTALADRYTIYEYCLNRKEALFTGATLPDHYDDDTLTNALMAYITSDKQLMRMKCTQVIEQLPMRMTRSRFFQILESGLTIYKGGEKKSLDDILYMIRTSALLTEPAHLKEDYTVLYEGIQILQNADYENLDAAQFEQLQHQMKQDGERLQQLISLTSLLTELVNDLYVQLLALPYAMAEVEEKQRIGEILGAVSGLFAAGGCDPVEESVYQLFEALEGKQEQIAGSWQAGISSLNEITETNNSRIENLMLDKIYHKLDYISRLMSGSLYVELEDAKDAKDPCTESYLQEQFAALYTELKDSFHEIPKYRMRAVMAKILTFLPPFLMTYEELREYISSSLVNCKDAAEKTACVEILESFLREE